MGWLVITSLWLCLLPAASAACKGACADMPTVREAVAASNLVFWAKCIDSIQKVDTEVVFFEVTQMVKGAVLGPDRITISRKKCGPTFKKQKEYLLAPYNDLAVGLQVGPCDLGKLKQKVKQQDQIWLREHNFEPIDPNNDFKIGKQSATWDDKIHSKDAIPDYDILFDDTVVRRLDISIDSRVHAAMTDNKDPTSEPAWGPVSIRYNDLIWSRAGMRWRVDALRGIDKSKKVAFRFNMDKFEDDYPDIKNQRFYGFKKMTFSPVFGDPSFIREKLAEEVMKANHVPSPRVAFVRVYLNVGTSRGGKYTPSGPQYYGLYHMIEDPSDDAFLQNQFNDDKGNLYKPVSSFADYNDVAMSKKTNEDDKDFTDVRTLHNALHSSLRRSSPSLWRTRLEAVFEVPEFLRWLAVTTAISNWNSYGFMAHNFYLYAHKDNAKRLTWVPWEQGLSFGAKIKSKGLPAGANKALPAARGDVADDWPLIRYLLDDPSYFAAYKANLRTALSGPMNCDTLKARSTKLHALVQKYVVGPQGEQTGFSLLAKKRAFKRSVKSLDTFCKARQKTLLGALGKM